MSFVREVRGLMKLERGELFVSDRERESLMSRSVVRKVMKCENFVVRVETGEKVVDKA